MDPDHAGDRPARRAGDRGIDRDAGWEARREGRAPICPWCGVTALPGTAVGSAAAFACDNEDCPAFGEPVG